MKRALELSRRALSERGRSPSAAVIVKDGRIVGEGLNHVLAHCDPTSHGETEAIRDACRNLKTVSLSGCDLYTSCEPCPLCVAAMNIARIDRLYYAASLKQADPLYAGLDDKVRYYFNLEAVRRESGSLIENRSMPSEQRMDGEALAIITEWVTQARTR